MGDTSIEDAIKVLGQGDSQLEAIMREVMAKHNKGQNHAQETSTSETPKPEPPKTHSVITKPSFGLYSGFNDNNTFLSEYCRENPQYSYFNETNNYPLPNQYTPPNQANVRPTPGFSFNRTVGTPGANTENRSVGYFPPPHHPNQNFPGPYTEDRKVGYFPPPYPPKPISPVLSYRDSDEESQSEKRREKVPILKPGTFDGSSSWREYLTRFLNCAQGNHWSKNTSLQQLKNCLTGPASSIVLKNPNSSTWSFDELIEEVDLTYGPRSKHAAILKIELRSRRRAKGEALHTLRDDIYSKVFDIYGDHNPSERDSISVEIFVQALGDPELVQKLLEKAPSTLAEAYQIAYNFESTKKAAHSVAIGLESRSVRSTTEAERCDTEVSEVNHLREQVEELTNQIATLQNPKVKRSSVVCHYCEKPGHIQKFCRQKLANIICFFCNQKGHHIRDCPEKQAHETEKHLK